MHPFRAFLISFAAGSIALFGGYGTVAALTPAPAGNTITV
jgi:Na+/glutamate symporter